MGEYEPDDSRDVTQSTHQAPGEPPRTGPREGEARAQAVSGAKDESEKVEKRGKPTARDAAGNKQSGYAKKDGADAEEDPPLGK
jgi:hypothetical protein